MFDQVVTRHGGPFDFSEDMEVEVENIGLHHLGSIPIRRLLDHCV